MEHVLDRARLTIRRDPLQIESEVLAHVADANARVPAPLRLFFANLGSRHRSVGAGGFEIWSGRQGLSHRLVPLVGGKPRSQLAPDRQPRVPRHAGPRLELEGRALGPAPP